MQPVVSVFKIIGMVVSMLLAVGVPVALAVIWHKRTGAKWVCALVGAITFYVFVNFLEGSLHALCLGYIQENAFSAFLKATPWAYMLYGGFAAGIFEETGRFVAFKWLLKKQTGRETGVMYGIGHGGIEAILLCAVSMVSNLVFASSLNRLGVDGMLATAGANAASIGASIDALVQTNASMFYIAGLERMTAIALHIALSVLVFTAVRRKGKRHLYPIAIVLHAAVDCVAVLYQTGVISNIWIIELVVFALAALVCVYAYRVYQADKRNSDALSEPDASADTASVSAP